MSKILIVAATAFEIDPLLQHFNIKLSDKSGVCSISNNVSILITGVGMVNTAYCVARVAEAEFDLLINAGVCGSFNPELKNGDVVEVAQDTLIELGAEDGDNFIPFSEMGFGGTATYSSKKNSGRPFTLKAVNGITVNTVHGNEQSIKKVMTRSRPDVESMEGAAFFRACEHLDAEYVQIRAISNAVEKRDKSKWELTLAISNLNKTLIQIIRSCHEA